MNLLRNISSVIRQAASTSNQLERAMANPDLTPRMPTLSSLASAAASADAASAGDGRASAAQRSETAPAQDHAVLRFPLPAGGTRAPLESADAAPVVYSQQGDQVAILKAGQQSASWSNPFVSHALPAVLQLRRHLASGPLDQSVVRTQLGLEVRLYRERLASSGCAWDQIRDASYLLCTYLDENVSDAARAVSQAPYEGERSLLVEFHDDAWGGEDAFSDLGRWMKADDPPVALLAFYELILSLGWQGRYRVLDRGDVLLQDLRSQLHALIWHHMPPEPLGTGLIAPTRPRRRWWTPAKVSAVALSAVLLTYGIVSAVLDSQGRPIRNALAAWMPPPRTINLAESLPPPLPQLLSEGWLTAYKHPQGWLLVFRSDGAFDVGRARVRDDFEHNIERLGLAFAPWPGDLEVIGHTDRQPIRTKEFANNQALSEARARTVADELHKTAVPGGAQAPTNAVQRNIGFSGRGDTQPIDAAQTAAAYERNRRVDVLWKVIPGGGKRATEASAAPERDAAAPPVMPEGVVIAPDGQSPYATKGKQP
ncbi:type IVB secretion system protein IcmH/DotU [Burkholderia stagnalis]|uniref:type IVB secretion system protein IcmH/DotU n=1 Tax=Burkholderia stagnalis TaxID=1503054 RepID=UPI000F81465E|nr:type IVB secretion system protein IcmH/DotU [Burkholderia stagnalis]